MATSIGQYTPVFLPREQPSLSKKPGRPQSTGSQRVREDRRDLTCIRTRLFFFLVEAIQLRITFYVWYTFLKTSDNSGLIFPWTKYWNATFGVRINLGTLTLILWLPCCQPFPTLFHYPCPIDTLSYQLCYPGQVTWPVCASVCTSAKVMIQHTPKCCWDD